MLPFWSKGRLPTDRTLAKYGLTMNDWLELFNRKMGCCHVCGNPFGEHRINVDHVHVKGWNQMAPEQRKQYVRGLLCYQCNKFAAMRGVTSMKAWSLYMYLRAYDVRVTPQALAEQSRNLDTRQQVVKRRNVRHTNQKQDKKHKSS